LSFFSAGEILMDVRLLDLAADSVSMVRITNRLEADLGVRAPLDLLLDNPTVQQLADYYCSACTALAGA
jgi:acyl carrier protein